MLKYSFAYSSDVLRVCNAEGRLFAIKSCLTVTSRAAAPQAPLSFTISQSLLKFMSFELGNGFTLVTCETLELAHT